MDHKITWQHLLGSFTHSGKSITVRILKGPDRFACPEIRIEIGIEIGIGIGIGILVRAFVNLPRSAINAKVRLQGET